MGTDQEVNDLLCLPTPLVGFCGGLTSDNKHVQRCHQKTGPGSAVITLVGSISAFPSLSTLGSCQRSSNVQQLAERTCGYGRSTLQY